MTESLADHDAFVLGAIDSAGRAVAVALAESGATVSVTTATKAQNETFFANSILNETWSMGRAGAAFSTDGHDLDEVRAALLMARSPLLVAMPSVSDRSWPGELAGDAAADLILIHSTEDGFSLSRADKAGRETATDESVGQAVVSLLAGA